MRLQDHETQPMVFATKRVALRDWLAHLAAFVPCDRCERNWEAFLVHDPLPEDTDGAETPTRFWEWSVRAHNHANQVTSKRVWTLEEAEAAFHQQWLDPQQDQQLDLYQRARLQDQQKVQAAEAEVGQLRQQQMHSTATNIALLVAAGVTLVLILLICGWVLWRGGQRAAVRAQVPTH